VAIVGSDIEIWRSVVGYEGRYGVSNRGRVRTRHVLGGRGEIGSKWRLMKPIVDGYGRLIVFLCLRGKETSHKISHLVSDAFLPAKSPVDTVVRHLSDDKTDNRVENLARGTQKDNMADSLHNGTRPRGITHGMAKLTEDDVREIRRLYATGKFSLRELGLRFGVGVSTICMIVRLQRWKHIV